jgi:hypothetical protein
LVCLPMRFLRSLEDLCCLGRCSHSRSRFLRFRSLALVPSSGPSSLVQVSRWSSNEMNCRRCVHLCLSELTLPRPGHPPALVGPKTRAFRGGAPGAYEGHARSPLAALPPLRWPRWIIGCGSCVKLRRQGCGLDFPALNRQTCPNAFLLGNVEPSAGQDSQECCARQ